MSWNEEDYLSRLSAAVERFDRDGASRLVNELIAALDRGETLSPGAARKTLQSLRRKCFFDLMERAAEALRQAGQDEPQIRRQQAQALIDQGKMAAAADVLEALVAKTAGDPAENAEARGLLGRVHKQLYVNAVNADPAAASSRLAQRHLARAVEAYHEVYRSDPARHLWHGINTVALLCRARRDGVALAEPLDAAALAREILACVEASGPREQIPAWDLATAAEACVALDRATDALLWIGLYVQRPQAEADAFELASTLRQLTEVWRLTVSEPPGSLLLPILQANLLERKGGRLDLAPGELGKTLASSRGVEAAAEAATRLQFEKILGREGVVTFKWYELGLERSRRVAQVQTLLGEGLGTGFLVRGGDFSTGLEGQVLLLTNAHVVSGDPAVQQKHQALDPCEAQVAFEELPAAAGQIFRVRLIWSSPPEELDATLLALDPAPPAVDCFPLARNLPTPDGQQKVYVIGHPGGRSLSFSIHDNLLLDHDKKRLLHYRAPTEGGSSGSPVFNQQWSLIGLHHAGGLELQRLNGQAGTYAANEGIWIRCIVAATEAAGLQP
jgi:hypothetical protein